MQVKALYHFFSPFFLQQCEINFTCFLVTSLKISYHSEWGPCCAAISAQQLLLYLMYCTTSACSWTTCSGSRSMTPSLWSSCSSYTKFYITAMGKKDGEPINSGDTVSLKSYAYGSSYRLRCTSSYSWYCRIQS